MNSEEDAANRLRITLGDLTENVDKTVIMAVANTRIERLQGEKKELKNHLDLVLHVTKDDKDRIAELECIIADAPHESDCDLEKYHTGSTTHCFIGPRCVPVCTCWKSEKGDG